MFIYLYIIYFFNLLYYKIYKSYYQIYNIYTNKKLYNSKFDIFSYFLMFSIAYSVVLKIFFFFIFYFKYINKLIFIINFKIKNFKFKLFIINLFMYIAQLNFIILIKIKLNKIKKFKHLNKLNNLKYFRYSHIFQIYYNSYNIYIIYLLIELYQKFITYVYNKLYIYYYFIIPLKLTNIKFVIKKIIFKLTPKRPRIKFNIFNNINFNALIKLPYYKSKNYYKYQFKSEFISSIKYRFICLHNNILYSSLFIVIQKGYIKFIYYIFLTLKYTKSIIMYIWKSDVIYKFLKRLERKKW